MQSMICLHRTTPAYLITVPQGVHVCVQTEVYTCIGYLFITESKCSKCSYECSIVVFHF